MNKQERAEFDKLEALRITAPTNIRQSQWFRAFEYNMRALKKAGDVPKKKAPPKKKPAPKAPVRLSLEEAHDETNKILEAEP